MIFVDTNVFMYAAGQPHPEFRKSDLDARQVLYRKLAEQIWNPENLRRKVDP